MILEGIVTTLSPEGHLNVAPMGPQVDDTMRRFVLRPYRSSTTYRNLKARGEGVLHVTDDVLLLARSAVGFATEVATRPAEAVVGRIILDACRYYEFRVIQLDDRDDRTTIAVETVAEGRLRDFFGFNRAKHAVIEAAILATRTSFLPLEDIRAEFKRLEVLVAKTGGPAEHAAFDHLKNHIDAAAIAGDSRPDDPRS